MARLASAARRTHHGEQQCRGRAACADEGGCLAIASATAGERYGLKILHSNIEDEPDNTTRFLVIGRQQVAPSGTDKTSLLVSTRNRPGALHRLLAPLSLHGISMTRIESRPSRRSTWDYVFFVDIEGHQQERQGQRGPDGAGARSGAVQGAGVVSGGGLIKQ